MLIKGELDFSELDYGRGRKLLWRACDYSFIPIISRLKHFSARIVSITSSFEDEEVLLDYYFELNDKSCIVRLKTKDMKTDSIAPFFAESKFIEKEIASVFKVTFL